MINDPGSHLEAEVILPKPARLQAQLGVSQDLSNTPVKNESRARGEEEGDKQSRLQQDLAYMQRRYRSAFASTPSPEGKFTDLKMINATRIEEGSIIIPVQQPQLS